MTRAGSASNKRRGASDERDVARILGGKRHLADTGGPEDVSHPDLAIQVKGGKAVVSQAMRDGLVSARLAALDSHKLPAVVLVDRKNGRLQRWVCFPLEEYADYHGYGAPQGESEPMKIVPSGSDTAHSCISPTVMDWNAVSHGDLISMSWDAWSNGWWFHAEDATGDDVLEMHIYFCPFCGAELAQGEEPKLERMVMEPKWETEGN